MHRLDYVSKVCVLFMSYAMLLALFKHFTDFHIANVRNTKRYNAEFRRNVCL
jgi:hypothetical protein